MSGPGEIVATDNGDPTDLTAFSSLNRQALNGYARVIVRSVRGVSGEIRVRAKSKELETADVVLRSREKQSSSY